MAQIAGNRHNQGLTLVELLIVVAIGGIVLTGAATIYQSHQKSSSAQEKIMLMQQDTRVAMDLMTNELRTAGYNPSLSTSGTFGVTDIRFRDLTNALDATANGNSAITFTADLDGLGSIDAPNETVSYSLYDFSEGTNDIASRDLSRDNGSGRQLVVESIQALGLAYAFDANGDGTLDTNAAGNTIWAIDQGNNNSWDNLDTNNDGAITAADAPPAVNGLSIINATATGATFNLNDIRAIRVWILARSKQQEQGYLDPNTYVVGRQVIIPSQIPNEINNGGYRYRLLESIVYCRNLGL